MNRREFLTLSGLTGLSAIVPVNFIVDNRDNETKFLQYIIETYNDEVAVTQLIKQYAWCSWSGQMADGLNGLVKRQPEVIAWMKSRIKLKVDPVTNKRTCSSPGYARLNHPSWLQEGLHPCKERQLRKEHQIYAEKWTNWTRQEYDRLASKFDLPIRTEKLI